MIFKRNAVRRFAPLPKGPSVGGIVVVVVVIVRHKVGQSYISRTFRPKINKFYRNLQAVWLYLRTGYDVTDYFRLAVIEVQKRSTASLLYVSRTIRGKITLFLETQPH